MTDKHLTQSPAGEFIMFASDDGEVRVECRFEQETLWLPQATIANLYQITPQAITQHIKAIYEEGELEQNATCKSYLQVKQEGKPQYASLQPTRHSCHRLSCPLPPRYAISPVGNPDASGIPDQRFCDGR